MERKKRVKEHHPEQNAGGRIWPGVLLITVCACLVFTGVYVLGYRAGLLPLPGFFRFGQGEAETEGTGDVPEHLPGEMIVQETTLTYFRPENEDPVKLLETVSIPESFQQRMRFTVTDENSISQSWVTHLYKAGDCWRIEQGDLLYICDGEKLWRANAEGNGMETDAGGFTWQNQLGVPTLEALQEAGSAEPDAVNFRAADMTIEVVLPTGDSSRILCRISLDTGLVTEMQVFVGDRQSLFMYSEQVSVMPEICKDMSLFSWTADEIE